ncbi:methionyl-tRNA synthetase [Gregarina niphandrodes]|uniref:methionine--tRNA ligase n=1 Tax=Gregarina niphandrodes TaxID=110365 RepID=A0A023BDR6_GRENI|nr:methionyl-tRNA synthetase [Gregarina niphandrodes]EZG88395.1 methionyl-tRNA synthetase [Gregarina niphandrodes]|eukprot:XP_011128569.1 methionyl-tRNA synthetase [Gregarina niphandrodes]
MVSFENRAQIPSEKFYLTTAIAYLNGPPHVGHAYEFATADVISRYHEIAGRDVHFVTGSDEHGQKVENMATANNVTPQEWCNKTVNYFKTLNARLDLGEHTYIRTTDKHHEAFAQWMWRRVESRGDLYLGSYKGWYNVKEEAYVTDREAESHGYKNPETGIPYEQRDEEAYFFRMSKYHKQVEDLIRDTDFVQPASRRNELLQRLEKAPLEDLCVSRVNLKWGIPVPDNDKHVMYVWFDALSNYLSAIRYNEDDSPTKKYWPAACHLIGKDITWFHCVIWPAMLLSAELPLPKVVYGHGFVQACDGSKMSKSLNNVVSPMETLDRVPSDSFRYYLVREGHYGQDIRFNPPALVDMHNSDLCATFGNLLHRVVALAVKYEDGQIPDIFAPEKGIENATQGDMTQGEHKRVDAAQVDGVKDEVVDFVTAFNEAETAMHNYALENLANVGISLCRDINKYLTDAAPWKIKDDPEKRATVIRKSLEGIYIAAHFLYPVIPQGAGTVFKRLATPPKKLYQLDPRINLTTGTVLEPGEVLYAVLPVDILEKTA